ncbi:MAG: MATE family efflux transporter [Simkaniaceae bacterium]|nr:MATE family efflux transporter [Candidatus Sacchlamyda saccharinae]
MSQSAVSSQSLTSHPPGGLRELIALCVPLMLGLLSASLMGFCDRIFLAHYGLESMEGSVSAGYLCMLFQLPLIRLVSMAQVFVGLFYGSKRLDRIGPAVWQMVWLSIFSMLFTLPSSQFVAPFFFGGTPVQEQATIYFNTLMVVNFLFPLGTTLSCFFMGRGKMRIILLTTLLSHGLNIGLDYVFIFGIEGIFPSLGIFGAALATGISQLLFCLILFFAFLSKPNRAIYRTDLYHFRWENFWGQMRVGLPRAIARIIILTAWVSISRLITMKGGDYLMVLSVGGSLILLFTFISDGMLQGMITVASNLMGTKEYDKIWKLVRSGTLLLALLGSVLAVPYMLFPKLTLSFFFTDSPSPETFAILKKSCIWLWVFFMSNGINAIGQSLVTASRDLTFLMCSIIFVWCTSYLPVYLGMNVFHFSADKLWLIMAFDAFVFGLLFLWRASKEKWRDSEKDFELNGV